MNKKAVKYIGLLGVILITLIAVCNIYNWIVCGNQYIKINMPSKAYTNSDFYISIIAQDKGVDLETKSKIKLVNSNGSTVKDVKTKYDGNNAILSIPKVEAGNYFLEAEVSSKAGKDTIKKEIYISNGNLENTTITLDKGIYKPGDTVNYRALLTSKENDEPVSKDVNVSIYDGNDNRVYNENIKSSDYGIISGKFSLANEVNSGLYKLIVKTQSGETIKNFKVNPYITPKYEVKINYDKESYLVGETTKITFNTKYFFGEAVQNADLTVYINNEEYKKLKTNSEGIATLDYEIKEAKTYNIKVEAVDSSNYFVEATSSFTAGTDIFEVQLLPEFGTLASGKKNDIYVFTNKADGTPIKTYVTVSSNNFTKQIATDENGVGKFSIDIESISTNNNNYKYYNSYNYYNDSKSTKQFSVVAEDLEKNSVNKKISLDVEQKSLLVSTNKAKYEQGEDIKINISSVTENAKNVYFFKNDKLVKMLTTEFEDATINLDDTYGLIDIYVTENNGTDNNYYQYGTNKKNTYKKTIFIKPTKQLNIGIKTDKEEYKPGEKINISFNTSDENKTGVDAALLVSMLDNSILNLASNDLSIDNIKLALQNIKFSDELDAATLYSSIIDDSSEQTMMALLLKQSNNDINVSETGMYNYEQKEISAAISITSIASILIIILIFLLIKFKTFRNIMKHIVTFIMYDLLLVVLGAGIIFKFSWSSNYSWWEFAVTTVIGLATYIAWVHKLSSKTIRTSISIIITFGLYMLLGLLVIELEIPAIIIILIFAVLLLILVVLSKISNVKKLKIDKYMKSIMKEIVYIIKYVVVFVISVIIGGVLQGLLQLDMIIVPISLSCIYFLNYHFNQLGIKEKSEIVDKEKRPIGFYIIIGLAIIGLMTIGYFVKSLFTNESELLTHSSRHYDDIDRPTYGKGTITPDSVVGNAEDFTTSSSTSGMLSIMDGVGELFSSSKNESNTTNSQESVNESESQKETVTDNKVRNVFLESMCFIPELITTNGNANIDLNLSDNITTWTIQTVGNTKDGRIGYGSLDNVKVFKDFFADFELPKNLVETDNVSIPVTVYNYTDSPINTTLRIKEEDWFKLGNNNINVNIDAKSAKMGYIPISILKAGNNKFRVEISGNNLTDIVEKECVVSTKGYKVEKVVSTGNLDRDISEDILFLEDTIPNTAKAKVKIYSSTMSQTIEGMENIFKMPTGCFEQISSSLYPNILALKYLEDNKIVNDEIKEKAISYISSGYQKLLTYEVKGESGGYSLYGHSPAETVLTAYGLMEITDLSKVYDVDNSVIEKMTDFLYKKQNANGTFTITGSHIGGANSRETLSLNAYITWALSESNPKDERLKKSVEYLKGKLSEIDDNYTLALVANTLANVKDNELNNVLKRLVNNVNIDGNNAYIKSNITDYYGSRYDVQTVQTVALTSMALSKASYSNETNKLLINYLISQKDTRGTWYSTQATILALKALNARNEKSKLENQTITVKVNSDEKKIEIKDNPLDLYELTFENLNKENKLNIDIEKGNAYYEVIEEYYLPYENIDTKNDNIEISVESNNNLKVNDILKSNIKIVNKSGNLISNGMVTISIPQGFTVIEESLAQLESKGIIEKYETSYSEINIYLRNFEAGQVVDLSVWFRARYPVEITGMSVKAYDYYNPNVQGKTKPIEIKVNN